MNPTLRMIVGCIFPLVAVFLLPLIGVSDGVGLLLLLTLIFSCHLIICGHRSTSHDEEPHASAGGTPHGK